MPTVPYPCFDHAHLRGEHHSFQHELLLSASTAILVAEQMCQTGLNLENLKKIGNFLKNFWALTQGCRSSCLVQAVVAYPGLSMINLARILLAKFAICNSRKGGLENGQNTVYDAEEKQLSSQQY